MSLTQEDTDVQTDEEKDVLSTPECFAGALENQDRIPKRNSHEIQDIMRSFHSGRALRCISIAATTLSSIG